MERRIQKPDFSAESVLEPLFIDPDIVETNPMRRLSSEDWHLGGEVLFSQAREQGLTISCAFIDADALKEINDNLNHDAGDAFLGVIDSAIRHSDLVGFGARVGGDEWKILSVVDEEGAAMLKERIKSKVQMFLDQHANYQRLGAGVSVGIATAHPEDDINLSELLRQADQDMYRDKENNSPNYNKVQRLVMGAAGYALRAAGVSPGQFARFRRSQK